MVMDSCMICLSFCNPLTRITAESLEWKKEQIQRVVEKHLWWLYLQPEPDGQRTKWICKSCWQEISSFHNFYLKVERIHKQYQTLLLTTNNFKGETIHDVKKKRRNKANRPVATTLKSTEDSSHSSSSNMETYEKHMIKHEIPEHEQQGNECFDSLLKNEPVNEDYEKTEYNFEIFEVEEPQYNDNHNHRITDNTSDSEKQIYNYNCSYNAINSDEEEADNESVMRHASLEKLKKNGIIDFYEEFQFKLECIICNSIESTFASLCVHYKNQHNMRGFAMCCGVKFTHRYLLIDHLCVHKDPNFFKCKKCQRVYRARNNLHSHLRRNRCTPKYECDQCGKQFLIQKNLLRHKLTHLKPIDKIFNCEKCHTPFESVEFLREHEKNIHVEAEEVNAFTPNIVSGGDENITPIVKSEPPDDTGILQDEFIALEQSNTLKLKTSTEHRDNSGIEEDDNSNGDKEKDTSACKTFGNMDTTSGSDEFFREMQFIMKCNLCSIILSDFQSLLTHYRVAHNTEGYGVCCGRKFHRRGVLADHLKLHKDPNLFTCQLCNNRFTARRSLKKHMDICAKKLKNYECLQCHTAFKSVEFLREHEKHCDAEVEVIVVTPNIVLSGDENNTPIVKSEPPDDTGILQDESVASEQYNTPKFKRKLQKSTEHSDNGEVEENENSNEEGEEDTSVCKTFGNRYRPTGSDEFFREMQYIMHCNLCNIILPDFQSLITHYRVAHNTDGYAMCCGRKFHRRGVLTDHLKLHKDPNLFTCQLCNNRFTARRSLEKHIETCAKKLKKYI